MKMFRPDQRKDQRRDWTEEELEQQQVRRRVSPGKVSGTSSMVYMPRDADVQQPAARAAGVSALPIERRRWAGEAPEERALFGMTRSDDLEGPMLGRGAEAMKQLAWRPEAASMRPAALGGTAEAPIQGKSIEGLPAREIEIQVTGSGEPLPEEVRTRMEAALGMDFSGVRIHVGPQAASVGALAFTKGTDIFFAPGQYQPWSQKGLELIGHELTHVVQQAEGRVGTTRDVGGVAINDDAGLERQADEMGGRAARQSRTYTGAGRAATSAGVQRVPDAVAGAPARPSSRGLPVQRMLLKGGTKKNPYYYSSYDPERHFDSADEADAYDAELTRIAMQAPKETPVVQEDAPVPSVRESSRDEEEQKEQEPLVEQQESGPLTIEDIGDQEWERVWLAKLEECCTAMEAFVPRFQDLDPDAVLRIRGSLASGVKGPQKLSQSGERLLFNPDDFDIDAYVESDALYQEALDEQGTDDEAQRGMIPGSKLRSVNAIIRDMRRTLARIQGNRDTEGNEYRFNVLIRSTRNANFVTRKDRKAMSTLGLPEDYGNPVTVRRPT